MKKIIPVLILLLGGMATGAQTVKNFSKDHPVKAVDWGSQPASYVNGYLDMVKQELAKTFSKKLVDSIVEHCEPGAYPVKWKSLPKEEAKIYFVGTFNNMFRGSFHGVQYVLWVPYNENKKFWVNDYHLNPYDFFLLLPKEAVTLEEQ